MTLKLRRYLRRHTVKRALTGALTRVAPAAGRRRGRVAVLCYHSIHPTKRTATASPDLFDEQLQWLVENCDVVPLREIPGRSGGGSDRPTVAITFDDGFRDNVETALPALERHGLTATFFVTTGLVERDPEVLARFAFLLRGGPEEYDPMSWSQVRELDAAGMEVGDHTYRHSNLALWPDATVLDELRRSRSLLEEQLGHEVAAFAYPFGKDRRHVTRGTRDLVRSLGYRMAVSVRHRGVRAGDDALDLPRFTVFRDPVDRLAAKVAGPWDVVGWGQQWSPLWLAQAVSPDDFGLEPTPETS